MKLGVLTVVLYSLPLEDALKFLSEKGVQTVELGAGGYPGKTHLNPDLLLGNQEEIDKVKNLLKKYDIEISALSCHGNPIHPDKEIASRFHNEFEKTILLAKELGVDTVVGFSGCAGDSETAKYPNWVTCSWPTDYMKILDYQWNDVLIPYWRKMAQFAKANGINKLAFEMHPGFMVYNPETLLKLRAAVGDIIGANFDPSHLFWQGIDPVEAIRELNGAIYHFHAKDTILDKANIAKNGVLDTKSYRDKLNRSWMFRTVGWGSNEKVWKDMISMLRMTGYDGAISIEHEDSLMSPKEGLVQAIDFLKKIVLNENLDEIWWA